MNNFNKFIVQNKSGLPEDVKLYLFQVNTKHYFNPKKPYIIILAGSPASGKTTIFHNYYKDSGFLRINRDDLRKTLSGFSIPDYYKQNYHERLENVITNVQEQEVDELIEKNENLIIDNTHLDLKYIKNWLKLINNRANVDIFVLKGDLEKTMERDKQRDDVVGDSIINKMFGKVNTLIKNLNEFIGNNFDYKKWLENELDKSFKPINQNKNKPKSVIFDIDGTLAKNNERSPFDWHKVKEDLLNEPIYNCYKVFKEQGYKIIIFTGRDGESEEDTKEWLKQNNIEFDEFRIRPKGNREKDFIIKRRFLEEIINDYYVELCFDDRDSVVKMLRDSNIPCMQVDYGNF